MFTNVLFIHCSDCLHHKLYCLFVVVSLDQGLPPAPALIPKSLSKPLELGGVTYRVVEKHMDWTGALHLCESLNGTLATVQDPYQQAYLTLLINSLRRPAWIALYNYGVSSFTYFITRVRLVRLCFPDLHFCSQGRSFTWLGEEDVSYSNWKSGEPNQLAGCGHMTTTGQWTVTPCDAKVEAAICQISGECLYPPYCDATNHQAMHMLYI